MKMEAKCDCGYREEYIGPIPVGMFHCPNCGEMIMPMPVKEE